MKLLISKPAPTSSMNDNAISETIIRLRTRLWLPLLDATAATLP